MLRRSLGRLAKQAFAGLQQEVLLSTSAPTFASNLPSAAMTFNLSRHSTFTPCTSAALPWLRHSSQCGHARIFSSASEAAPNIPAVTPTSSPRQAPRLACVITPQSQPSQNVRVEATYVGSGINIYELMARPEFSGHYQRLHKGTVILGLTNEHVPEKAETSGMPTGPYLVATSYGSVVFFNVDPVAKEGWLEVLRSVASDPLVGDKRYNEEYIVHVVPELATWSQLEPEFIRLQTLDLRNMQVIAQVLAQSVALDYYSSHVERTLETFCSMNLEMVETASSAGVDKNVLLRLVAENNIVMTEIISKLGVHERYDIAWKYVQYGRIWEFLRSELEMEPRFKTLDMKLNLIQDNLKYFLEILQARKSDSLEWTIIILIAVEIGLSLYELGGKGWGA